MYEFLNVLNTNRAVNQIDVTFTRIKIVNEDGDKYLYVY